MTDRIDIQEPVKAICEAFDLEPREVRRLNITPGAAVVEVFTNNENGSKFITDEGVVAFSTHTFEVLT